MAKVPAPKVDPGEGFTPRQVVRVPNGLYGGMFAWYSLPKMYQRFNSTDMEERFYVGFVVTHDRAYRQLGAFSEAMMGIRPKLFYSSESGMKSSYVSLLYALLGGKKSLEAIADMGLDELPDFDTLVGRPVTLFLEGSPKADKNGLYGMRIKGIEPADRDLVSAIKPLYGSKVVEVGEKGTARLVTPAASYEDEIDATQGGEQSNNDDMFGDDDDEVPF